MPGGRRGPDSGFTLVEVIVSVMLISIVLAALTAFFVSATRVTRLQGGRQTAVQLATESMERARKLEPASLPGGRDLQSVNTQWASPVAGVDLSGMQKVYDSAAASGAGASAALPTVREPVTLDGVTYGQYWYLGKCWQPKGGGDCTTSAAYAEMYRVIVAVTWADTTCGGGCVYLTSTLFSSKYPDPLFNVNGG